LFVFQGRVNFGVNNISLGYIKETIKNLSNNSLVLQDYDFIRYYISSRLAVPTVTNAYKQSLGTPIDELIVSCFFNAIPCNMSYWVWYYDVYWGSCFRFNSGKDASGNNVPILSSTKGSFINVRLTFLQPVHQNDFYMSCWIHITYFIEDFFIESFHRTMSSNHFIESFHRKQFFEFEHKENL
jgi:hypothetical protein